MRLIKLLIKILIINLILILNSSANSFKKLSIPSNLEFKLNNYEYNQYLRRGMRAFADSEIDGKKNIKKKYKKWNEAQIILKDKTIKAKVRIMGDWKDHLRLPMTSLKVKIENDSFFGVTRFNLFLPHTRNNENEVFWSLLLSYLDYPTLYTRMIEVNFNGNRYRAIFQEDATKEFLERNNLTETVILKKNDFHFYLNDFEDDVYKSNFSSSFVVDNNNFLKNDISTLIASEAISYVSDVEFQNNRVINEKFFLKIMRNYSTHGLAEINRKYIYLPFKKMFIPLYYDGMIEFPPKKADCNKRIEEKILNKFKKDYLILTNKKLSPIQLCVLKDLYSQYLKTNIDKKEFKYNTDLSRYNTKYSDIREKIINFLSTAEPKVLNNMQLSKSIIYTFLYDGVYNKCFLDILQNKITKCEQINFNEYSKFISQSGSSVKLDGFSAFPINLGSFNNSNNLKEISDYKNEIILKDAITYLFTNKDIKEKSLKFIFKNSKSKLIVNGNFENTEFYFEKDFDNSKFKHSSIRYDRNLLTGCVNFLESNFKNVNIYSNDMICEDSINIKNSLGNINNIIIKNSFYDAIDLDFSNIKINYLDVNFAGNDCIDFSYGNYEIDNVKVIRCGDKGISVGENSTVILNKINVQDSSIGVASKDSSKTFISKATMSHLKICLSAYKKKREFQGSRLQVTEFKCDNFLKKIDKDNLSKILIENEIK